MMRFVAPLLVALLAPAAGPSAASAAADAADAAAPARAASADSLADRVTALVEGFDGTVTLYAKNLGTGEDFALDADARVRTASTIKLPILCALASQVAAGAVAWTERLPMAADDRASGSGVLRSLEDGTDLTIRNLATLMIVVSDNTATNLILDRIGAESVNVYLDTLGLGRTRLNRKVGGPDMPSPGWSRAGRLEENRRFGLGVSTSREMVALLEKLHAGNIVSADVSKDLLAVLEKQQVRTAIGRHAPRGWTVASKSGSLNALRSDVGIVDTGHGAIAVAVTVDDMPEVDYSPENAGERLIWELTSALVDGLS